MSDFFSVNYDSYGGNSGAYGSSASSSGNTDYDPWAAAVAASGSNGGSAPSSVPRPPLTVSDPNTGRVPPNVVITFQTNQSIHLQDGTPAQLLSSLINLENTNSDKGKNYRDGQAPGSLIIPGGYVMHFASNSALENYLRRSLTPIVPSDDVAAMIQGVLGRAATNQDIASAEAGFYDGKTPSDLRSTLAHSAEAASDIGALYLQELNRVATAAELAAGETTLAGGGSLAGLRNSVPTLPEATAELSALYQNTTGHSASMETLQALRAQLEQPGESLDTVRARVAHSDGKAAVDGLYLWKLGRPADAGGEAAWQTNLAIGTTVSTEAVQFAQSAEAASTIGNLYANLTGHAATTAQVAQYQSILVQPWAGMQDVRTAIAASTDAIKAVSSYGTTMLGGATLSSATIQQCEQQMMQPGATLAGTRVTIAASPEAIAAVQGFGASMLNGATLSPATIQQGQQALLAPGADLSATRSIIAASPDAITAVQNYGSAMLGGGVTLSGATIQQGQQALLAPGTNLDATRMTIAKSPEAAGVVANLYVQELGRVADPAGLASWQAHLGSDMTLAQTRAGIANSDEAASDIEVAYQSACGQRPSQDTLACARTLLTLGVPLGSVQATLAQAGQSVAAQSGLNSGEEPHGLLYQFFQEGMSSAQDIPQGVVSLISDFVNDPLATAQSLGPSFGSLGVVAGEIPSLLSGLISGLKLIGSTTPDSGTSIATERQRVANLIHQRNLGTDPARGPNSFSPQEAATATRLEQFLGRSVSRSSDPGADWVDAYGKTYDAVGPVPPKNFNLQSFTDQISRHVGLKQGLDKTVIDMTGAPADQINGVNAYLLGLNPNQISRIIKLGF